MRQENHPELAPEERSDTSASNNEQPRRRRRDDPLRDATRLARESRAAEEARTSRTRGAKNAKAAKNAKRRPSSSKKRGLNWRIVLIDAVVVAAVAAAVIALVPGRESTPASTNSDVANPATTTLPLVKEPDYVPEPEPELLASRPVSDWLLDAKLVAHAGGAYREGSSEAAYTNARETLTQNYDLKLRAFEFDFSLTTDNDLACLHDWDSNSKGRVNSTEWANSTVKTSSGAQLTPMLVGDLYDIMLGLPNMVLVADSKAFQSNDPNDMSLFYQRLVDAAKERDATLLDRVVPYVYSKSSYEACMAQHDFDCVIYAAYGNPSDTADGIVDFACSHDNIKGVCVAAVDKRLDADHIAQLHAAGKKLYTYTINTTSAAQSEFDRGVDAVITDSLVPNDLD